MLPLRVIFLWTILAFLIPHAGVCHNYYFTVEVEINGKPGTFLFDNGAVKTTLFDRSYYDGPFIDTISLEDNSIYKE